MKTRKVPPPPPDADLSPFEVGAYMAGHEPEYHVHTVTIGGETLIERIEMHRRYLLPEAFTAWLETEDAKRTLPPSESEVSGFGGSMTLEQAMEAHAAIEKPATIQAGHLGLVKRDRTAKVDKARRVASTPAARDAKAERMHEKDLSVLKVAQAILGKAKRPLSINALAGKVASALEAEREADHASDDKPWTAKSVSHRLERVKASLPPGKIIPAKTRSRD